jgi:CRP/FNR family transcriptional regulator
MEKKNCKHCSVKSKAEEILSVDELEELGRSCNDVDFKKGESIIKEGTLTSNVIYIKSGLVKIHKKGPHKELILRLVKAPSYLGLPSVFGDKINQYSATAIENSSACFISFNAFQKFIFTNGNFALEIIAELCRNEINDNQRWVNQSQKNVNGRMAETLCCISHHIFQNETFNLPLTQSELGDLTGTSRESVCRILTEFSQDGIISQSGKEISIINAEKLEKISKNG